MPISKQSSHLLWYWCMHTVTLLSKHHPVVNSCNNYVYHHTCGFMNSRLSVDVSALQVWTYWITPSESSWRYKCPAFPTYRGCMLQFQQEMKILMHVISPLLVQWMCKYITMSAQLHCVLWHTWGHPLYKLHALLNKFYALPPKHSPKHKEGVQDHFHFSEALKMCRKRLYNLEWRKIGMECSRRTSCTFSKLGTMTLY